MNLFIKNLVDELDANRAMFTALCLACDPQYMLRTNSSDNWKVQDHLSHIASYDQITISHFSQRDDSYPDAQRLKFNTDNDHDSWNEIEIRTRKNQGIKMRLEEMKLFRKRSLELLTSATEKTLTNEVYFPGDFRRKAGMVPLKLWLRYWSKHDMLHAQAILQSVPEFRVNSDFQSWLEGDPFLEAVNRIA